jgi:hypothetical protein
LVFIVAFLSITLLVILSTFDFRCNFAYGVPMSSEAWVVTCRGCKCIITCFAIDPQAEHARSEKSPTPQNSALVSCPCCGSDYRYSGKDIVRGTPRRNPLCQRKQQPNGKMDSAVVVAASIVAAIRLRGEPITQSPKVVATISDSVRLVRMIVANLER